MNHQGEVFQKLTKYANFSVENELVCLENLKNKTDKGTGNLSNKLYFDKLSVK